MTKEQRYQLIKKVARKIELQNKSKHAMMAAMKGTYRKASIGKTIDIDSSIDIHDEEPLQGYTEQEERFAISATGVLDR